MRSAILDDPLVDAATLIEGFSSHIESVFARVGSQLGRGHTIFKEVNRGLGGLSQELSCAEIEGAATALQEISAILSRLADVLPAEGALLETIGRSTEDASSLLQVLFKQIQMIAIIARNARIEAASLAIDRDGFVAFTQEAYDLGNAVQRTIEDCAGDQKRLSDAVITAFARQKEFEERYHTQLLSSSLDLTAAHTELREQRSSSARLADLADASTRKIADAVGSSIISLQAGDGTRQRLEHIFHGIRLVTGAAPGIVPELAGNGGAARLICELQAVQLKDTEREFGEDIGRIARLLSDIQRDAGSVVGHGRSIFGGEDSTSSSFLVRIKQTLAQASALIATCENAGRLVDEALRIVEDTIAKFRHAISGLAEAAIDITLVGMNASLKAGNLGNRGGAFVVIANELQTTADRVSEGASRLKSVLDEMERSAGDLRELRLHGDPTQLARLEPVILQALREVEAGNDRLGKLMSQLVNEGVEFEGLMNSAQDLMTALVEGSAPLSAIAARLDDASTTIQQPRVEAEDAAALDGLFARYTMERERVIHREFLTARGLAVEASSCQAETLEADDGILLF
ncbi:MAG: chemotaxis protein [Rhizobiales bacterium]|nr:chemotaxis protein [Hyphomicrobiales bacterium]